MPCKDEVDSISKGKSININNKVLPLMLLLLIYINNIFTSQKVNAINAMPTTMLVVTYAMKPAILPFCNIWKLSFANVEKVVNPPQNPTVRNNCHELPSFDVLLNNPNHNPIIRQPARLTNSVAHGKPLLMLFMATDIRYRAAPPTKLPQPIIIVFYIISEIISILFCYGGVSCFTYVLYIYIEDNYYSQ